MAETIEQPVAIETKIAEYSPTAAALAGLRQRFGNLAFDLTTTKGDKEARAARLELIKLRTSLEAKRKELKAPALERARLIDEEAKRITSEIKALEDPIDQQITAAEQKKEADRLAKIESERRRVAGINDAIDLIRGMPARMFARPAVDIEGRIKMLVAMTLAEAQYQELLPAAQKAHADSLEQLRELHTAAVAQEAEAARIAEERAELARRQAEQAESERKERERIADEQKTAQARIDEQRAQLEKDQREARERQERADAKARQRREDEDRRAATERENADRSAREARQLNEAAMGEIQGIQHQVIIAQTGRLGVRAGGTLQCIDETLAETEAWLIDDRFGSLQSIAQRAKDTAVASIRALRLATIAQADQERQQQEQARQQREAAEVEEQRQAEARAEQRRKEEAAAIADKRVRDQAPTLLAALRQLVTVTKAMDCEQDGEKPTEQEYQAALAQAEAAIALAVDTETTTEEPAHG
jgi:hypothetical protein